MTRLRRAAACASLTLLSIAAAIPRPAGAVEPEAAPRFAAKDLSGKDVTLEESLARGPVLLDFWATWCQPCAASLPELQAMAKELGPRGLTVIGISIDGPRNVSKVRPFVARRGLTFANVIDLDGEIQRAYHVTAVPTAVLIDANGETVLVRQGYRPGEEKALKKRVLELLAARDAAPPVAPDGSPPAARPDSAGAPHRKP